MKKLVIGILAHVDAGKTTLSEALLYETGKIKKLGRVDNRDAFLDNFLQERERGITIFSKQAMIKTANFEIALLDTPGHVDFSSETERTLQVLDYAILVISGRDGIQAHTETLWKLLKRYNVPTFIFINKMDLDGTCKDKILNILHEEFSDGCIDFKDKNEDFFENISVCDENLLEKYLDCGKIETKEISELIDKRKVFPCCFGSALNLDGVSEFINIIEKYTTEKYYGEEFGAKVFKISRDQQGNRMTYLKITGGSLKVRTSISYKDKNSGETVEEKINMIRQYSGAKFEPLDEVFAGSVCTVLGLTKTYPGQTIGSDEERFEPVLEPVLTYRVILPETVSDREFIQKLLQFEDEDPQLKVIWNEKLQEINVHLMGEIQAEILKSLIEERFGIAVKFGAGRIIYKETIANAVEGVGHFEPLRHYAEVHLLLEPGEPGSGIAVESNCREEVLGKNWQRLVLTHLTEKSHVGVLTGAQLTDVKITLIAGRAHVKHTEGGDFRQATYRALRQGLMKANNILLEPFYSFKLEIPLEQIGRAINDIKSMSGNVFSSDTVGVFAVITGRAPVSEMLFYAKDVTAYTKGRGKFSYLPDGYSPCHNADRIIAEKGYDPEGDLENTPDSVFCSHGAGTVIKWNEVEKYMHVTSGVDFVSENGIPSLINVKVLRRNLNIDEKELEAIMEREFGPIRRKQYSETAYMDIPKSGKTALEKKKEYLIVDGYNVIFSWEGLKRFSEENFEAARHMLMDILSNYCGYTKCELVLVFDGYKVKGNIGERFDYHGIHVVYTKENETGDMYIEKLIGEIGKNYYVKVVTSDNLIQVAAVRSGVLRMSANEFREEVSQVGKSIERTIEEHCKKGYYRPFSGMDSI